MSVRQRQGETERETYTDGREMENKLDLIVTSAHACIHFNLSKTTEQHTTRMTRYDLVMRKC